MMRYAYLHEAVAAAVRRKFPQLTVTSDMPAGEVDGWPFSRRCLLRLLDEPVQTQ